MKRVALALTLCLAAIACTGDDTTTPPIDAAADVDATAGIDAATDGGSAIDAPGACVLPTASITCTDNTACTAVCGNAVCHNFMQVGMRCTSPCTPGGNECPSGWSCNNMGLCRPPN
ncbi:MAG: hypothetical protein R3B06_13435 [Kofleriaceae bacterium]